ncbi:strigolactone esterase D14-like [Phoenix dactylifera]|uniref:Strigolactone esterase D14-like n=1 Tax=Phoenix dactylifera TaxID=42345 RepID=A0A8B7C7J3_PHODC|nr:strigolactone esterase D14-like [Phoenix dactylifera]
MNAKIIGSAGQTLVLAHGYGGSQSVWDYVLPDLAQRYRVVVFDWSFSGSIEPPIDFDTSRYSSYGAFSEDLISLMDDMNLREITFVGHSMAGMIGCIAAVKRPDLFAQLVLLGASPRYLNAEGYEGGLKRTEVDEILTAIESNFRTWAKTFCPPLIGVDHPDSIEKFERDFLRMRPEIAVSVARMVFMSDFRDVLEKVEVRCTIVQCTDDIVVPMTVAYYMQSKIKGRVSLELVESGHCPQLTAPQLLIDILDRVLIAGN